MTIPKYANTDINTSEGDPNTHGRRSPSQSPLSILIVGVGGQGTLLASRILAGVALRTGYDVKVSEIHGMAQRGGSVVTQVRFGTAVASPIITRGQADIILAFEKLEALRWLPYAKKAGTILYNTQSINPMPVITGAAVYPADADAQIQAAFPEAVPIEALALARTCGTPKAVNVVLLGLLSRFLSIEENVWKETLRETVPSRFLDINMAAFQVGRTYRNEA
ncbi:MAG: indolepyruvate oxidoreductase subunit beta [Peptococcaceae bacterium]|nr:indolepyruvate oxidoreductase subunit beta [Peptococcaceae bacterium]